MYDYGYSELISLQQETNEKLDTLNDNISASNVLCGAILIFVIVGVLLSIVKG